MAEGVKWDVKIPTNLSITDYIELKCSRDDPGMLGILNRIPTLPEVVIYHNCPAAVYSAAIRHTLEVPKPTKDYASTFNRWFDHIWETEILPILDKFTYSHNAWFNTLSSSQQRGSMKVVEQGNLWSEPNSRNPRGPYTIFPKLEKLADENGFGAFTDQVGDPGSLPKFRAVEGPTDFWKEILGPISKRLNILFGEQFFGYCSGKNWEEMEKEYRAAYMRAFLWLFKGDMSALDRSMTELAKNTVNRVYNYLTPLITHCSPEVWLACINQAIFIAELYFTESKDRKSLGKFAVPHTRMTGDPDTTFGNTFWVTLSIRFVLEHDLGWLPREYALWVKGDDFSVAYDDFPKETIKAAFTNRFAPNITPKYYGNGMVLKLLEFTQLQYNDFCSTETFFCGVCKRFHITRQLMRFLTLTPYSQTALSLTQQQLDYYCHQLATANSLWIHNLPIFRVMNNKLFRPNAKPVNLPNAKPKFHRDVSDEEALLYGHKQSLSNHEAFLRSFEKNYHSMLDRVSGPMGDCCVESYYTYLEQMYGVGKSQVDQVEIDLARDQPNGLILGEMLSTYRQRKATNVEALW